MTDFNPAFNGSEGAYDPDQLIAGDHPVRTMGITLASGENRTRGTLLGKITLGDDPGQYKMAVAAADDGSQDPVCILGEDIDASGGAKASFAYIAGDFNENQMTFGAGVTADGVREALAADGIYLHAPVKA